MGADERGDQSRPRRKRHAPPRRGWNPVVVVSVVAAVFVVVGLTVWGGVYLLKPKSDARLIGTWQSDAEATIAHRKTTHAVTDKNEEAMRKLFGKMKVTYTAKDFTWEMNGAGETQPYQVVSKDAETSSYAPTTNRPASQVVSLEGFLHSPFRLA